MWDNVVSSSHWGARCTAQDGIVECELEAHVSACVGIEQVYSTDAAINTCE